MKMTKEWEADIKESVRLERSFWQLVALLALFFGFLLGAGAVHLNSCRARMVPISFEAARSIQLVAEVDRLRAECAPKGKP